MTRYVSELVCSTCIERWLREKISCGETPVCPKCSEVFSDIQLAPSGVCTQRIELVRRKKMLRQKCGANKAPVMKPVPTSFACNYCAKVFRQPFALVQHMEDVHPNETELFFPSNGYDINNWLLPYWRCETCCEHFDAPHRLYKHLLFAHDELNYVDCAVCKEAFLTRDLLAQHKRTSWCQFVKEPSTNWHQCQACTRSFTSQQAQSQHYRAVHRRH